MRNFQNLQINGRKASVIDGLCFSSSTWKMIKAPYQSVSESIINKNFYWDDKYK